MFTTYLFQLAYFVISMFMGNPLTNVQATGYVLNGILNGLGLIVIIEIQ